MDNVNTELAEIGIRLLDDAYLSWFSAEAECEGTLHAWFEAAGAQRASAYVTYRAAVDREEAAARDLERLWKVSAACRDTLVHRSESVH